MAHTTKVYDMATLTRIEAIILEETTIRGSYSAIILYNDHYHMASQIDREHGLCFNSREREILKVYTLPDSPHLILRVRAWEYPFIVPAFYDAGLHYDFMTLEEAKQAIHDYSL